MILVGEPIDGGESRLGAVACRFAFVGQDALKPAGRPPASGIDFVDRPIDGIEGVASDLTLDRGVDADADRRGVRCGGASRPKDCKPSRDPEPQRPVVAPPHGVLLSGFVRPSPTVGGFRGRRRRLPRRVRGGQSRLMAPRASRFSSARSTAG